MDLATLLGVMFSVAAFGVTAEGANITTFLHVGSFAIVILGTLGALFVSFPLHELIKAPFGIGLRYAFFTPKAVRNRLSESLGLGEMEETPPEDLEKLKKGLAVGILMYSRMKTYAQATGWIGVLVGFVVMLRSIDDLAAIGQGMAICILTALYGTIIAYFICLPIQTKLERHLSLLQES